MFPVLNIRSRSLDHFTFLPRKTELVCYLTITWINISPMDQWLWVRQKIPSSSMKTPKTALESIPLS